MEKEFVSYEQAVALKELGAGFPYIAWYLPNNPILILHPAAITTTDIPAPLKQQVFRWFRDKHRLNSIVFNDDGDVEYGNLRFNYEIRSITYSFDDILTYYDSYVGNYFYKTYEEAENASLNRLIELVKKENNGTTLDSTE